MCLSAPSFSSAGMVGLITVARVCQKKSNCRLSINLSDKPSSGWLMVAERASRPFAAGKLATVPERWRRTWRRQHTTGLFRRVLLEIKTATCRELPQQSMLESCCAQVSRQSDFLPTTEVSCLISKNQCCVI